jgi:serine protease Do
MQKEIDPYATQPNQPLDSDFPAENPDSFQTSPQDAADNNEAATAQPYDQQPSPPPSPAQTPPLYNNPPYNAPNYQNYQSYPNDPAFQNPQGYTNYQDFHPYNGNPQYAYGAFPTSNPPQKKSRPSVPPLTNDQKKVVWLLRIAAILLAAIFAYCIVSDAVLYRSNSSEISTTKSTTDNIPTQNNHNVVMYQEGKPDAAREHEGAPDGDGPYTVAEVAALVSPSIVEITAYEGDTPSSSGSGIILSEDGYILTNAHVISDCDAYDIAFSDDEEKLFPAQLVGYDSKSDLAVLHTNQTGLIPATLGDSDELVVGEEVVAIGNPAGLTGTVTNGIVSALGRQIRTEQTGFYMECIQTNAAISPGNSGGALVNLYGQVVGITSSKYAAAMYESNTYEGLGFAITINQALPIVEELLNQGYVSGRVRIGISFLGMEDQAVAMEFSAQRELPEDAPQEGIWVTEISEDCDIADSELQVDDLILSVEGTSVNNYDELCDAIAGYHAGDVLSARCRRYDDSGNYKDFTIRFALMEDTSGDY